MSLTKVEQIQLFKIRDKFCPAAWEERGLVPRSEEVSRGLTESFNTISDKLISAISNGDQHKELKAELTKGLSLFKKDELDTEEREFVADIFFDISSILEIDINREISRWLYGSLASRFLNKNTKSIKTLEAKCSGCSEPLILSVVKFQEGIPDLDWYIVQCNSCKAYNLLSFAVPNIKMLTHGNYKVIENLPRNKYTEAEVSNRFNQIKTFRNN